MHADGIRRAVRAKAYSIRKNMTGKQSRREMCYKLLRRLGVRFVPIRVKNVKMWVDLHDEVLNHHFFVHQEYEPFETSLIERATAPGMTVVDIGAHIGYYTLHLALRAGTRGKVIAFEPDPTNMQLLKRNVQLNRLSNVICEQSAVLGHNGKTMLYLSNNNFGDHRVFDAQDQDRFNKGVPRESIEVRATALDSYLESRGEQADVIKMDIQGAEMLALPGMVKTLSNPNVVLFCEFWPYGLHKANTNPKQFLESLRDLGLQLFEIVETDQTVINVEVNGLSERFPDLGIANLICIHPSRGWDILLGYQ